MKMKFFGVPALAPDTAEAELNAFLGSHRVLSVKRHLVVGDGAAFWALCINYQESSAAIPAIRKGKIDYREVLSSADFTVFAELRKLRKELAQRDGVPPYSVFTNAQLAAMVRQRMQTPSELEALAGVGAKRAEKYGAAFVEALRAAWNSAADQEGRHD